MPKLNLDPSTLVAFGNTAAGHDGVLSDPSGELVIKPCTPSEIYFYESVHATHPELALYMPTFYGTLELNEKAFEAHTDGAADAAPVPPPPPAPPAGTASTLSQSDIGPLHGRKLTTDVSIVLENITGGFKKPNIMDIKLGARLWDDDAKPEKRARLDKVAAGTTSSSMGFRIAGMRVWQGPDAKGPIKTLIGGKEKEGLVELEEETKYKVYNKLYGREFNAENVHEGFEEFVLVPGAGITKERAAKVVREFLTAVKEIREIFEGLESRMYSASILLVYEGDPEAFDIAAAHVPKSAPPGQTDDAEEDEDEEEEEDVPKLAAIKLIDFAHANWTPGMGPDENALQGMRSTVKLLEELDAKLQGRV